MRGRFQAVFAALCRKNSSSSRGRRTRTIRRALLLERYEDRCLLSASPWPTHVGVPTPPPIATFSHETYADSSYSYDYGDDALGPVPYRIGPDGPYTHYIDPDHPNATDNDNPHGSHTTPRVTVPQGLGYQTLPAGSVVEVHGNWSASSTSNFLVSSSGTLESPIIFRGVQGDEVVHTGRGITVRGSHIIFENMKFDWENKSKARFLFDGNGTEPISDVVIRNSEFYNGQETPTSSYQAIRAKNNVDDDLISNLVVWDNYFYDMGTLREEGSQLDAVAVSFDANVQDAWVIGNRFHRIGGDAIQIAYDSYIEGVTTIPQRIYFAGNTGSDLFENVVDIKLAQDVVISQNEGYDIGTGYGTIGGGESAIAFRYGTGNGPSGLARSNIWTLYNEVHDSDVQNGAIISFTNGGARSQSEYFIGNVVYDTTAGTGKGYAFYTERAADTYWINNAAWNVPGGFFLSADKTGGYSEDSTLVANNIIGNIASGSLSPFVLTINGTPDALANRVVIKNNQWFEEETTAPFRVGVYDPTVTYTHYDYSEFCAAYASFCSNSFEADPLFQSPSTGGFELQENSPARDAGEVAEFNAAADAFEARFPAALSFRDFDFHNMPRIQGSTIDLGPHEFQPSNNSAPTLSDILDQSTPEDTVEGPLNFTVGDVETAASSLTVTATSDNQALIPDANLALGGSGANRTLTLTPLAGQSGTATITVTVTDGDGGSTSDTFVQTVTSVNDAPTLSDILDQSTPEDTVEGPLNFTVGDVETAASSLTVTATSDNQALIPDANLALGGSGANRTLTLTPLAGQSGTATITVTVTDGDGGSTSDTFVQTVTSVNDAPTLSDILDQSTPEDTVEGPLNFTVGDVETAASSLTVTATSDNQALIPDANLALGGSGANRTLTLTPLADQSGTATITVTVTDGDGGSTSDTFVQTVTSVNDAPTLSDILDQSTPEDTVEGPLNFTVGDVETAASSLTVTATSDNQALIPDANLALGGSGANRTLTLTPLAGQSGTATITVTVTDGDGGSTSDTFVQTVTSVNDAPTLSDILDQSTPEDTVEGPLNFTVGDVETAASSLTVTATSDNQALIPDANLALGGSGANRTLTLTPLAGQSGTATITVTVTDGDGGSTSDTFVQTVTSVNDAPTLSDILDQSTPEDTVEGPLNFTVGDVETAASSLTVTATSDNQALIPDANLALGGSGANRTLTLTPLAGQSGTATITVTVTDGDGGSTSDTFVQTVTSVNDAPTLSDILDQSTPEDTVEGPLNFTVGDVETAASSLTVTATSDNQALIPDANLALGGSGANRTLTLTPLAGQSGTATITVTVTDGDGGSTSDTFVQTVTSVNDAPTLSDILDQSTPEDTVEGPLNFTVGDVETAASSLTVTATSDNQALIPDANLALGGSGANRTLTLTPLAGQSGTATITVTVTDGDGGSTSDTFVQTVTSVNDAPTLSDILDQSTPEDTVEGPLNFTVGDVETAASSLTVTATSDNQALIPDANLALGGSGANRTLTLTPLAGQSGTATITVTVTDGDGGSTSDTFVQTVIGVVENLTIDNNDSEYVTRTGTWRSSTGSSGYYGSNYVHDENKGKGSKSFTFTPSVATAASYEVYLRWADGSNRANNVPVDVIHSNGTTTVTVDQTRNGGTWNLLGVFQFDAGTSGNVRLRNTGTNGYVIADAIQLAVAAPDTTAPMATLTDPATNGNIVAATLNSRGYIDVTFTDNVGIDASTITDAGGEFSLGGSAANGVVVDGAATLVSGSTYRYAFSGSFGIGTVSVAFTEGTWADNSGNTNATLSESFTTVAVPEKLTIDNTDSENVSLSGRWRSGTGTSGYYGSNYVHDENKGKGSKSFTFTPSVATAASYEVYLRWADGSNRANNVPVDVIHSNGTTTVTVDQTRNGGTWNLLGVFQFDAGTSGNVRLRNTGTNGYVIADAIQLAVAAPDTTAPMATLTDPATNGNIVAATLNSRGYIDVTFTDNVGIDASTITDAGGEFSLGGSAANGVVVDGAATLVSGSTYRYAFSGSFGIGTVSVAFTEGTWADNSGNTNATLSESFTTVAVPEKLTIDNTDSENVSLSGRWRSGTGTSGYYGSNYVHDENKGKGSKSLTFTPSVATAASYEVYLRWTDGSNRANNVPVDVIHSNGTTTVTVDQTRNGGTWNLLGVFQFDAGTSGNVRLRNTGTNGYVIADAIQLAVAAPDTTAPMATLTDPATNGNIVAATLNSRGYIDVTFTDNVGIDASTITDAGGEFSLGGSAANGVVVDGAATLVSGSTYRYAFSGSFGIGTVSVAFTEGTWADNSGNTNATLSESFTTVAVPEKLTIDNTDSENVSLSGRWRSGTGTSGYYGSNYVHDENKGKGSKSLTFTPSVATAASYEVYLRWTDGSNRANNVPVDIIHSNGTTTVTVDQTRNGGTWNLLGVFQFDAGTSGNVRLRNTGTNGYVIADAIQLAVAAPDTTAPMATLTDPATNGNIVAATLNSRGYIDVTFTDNVGIDASTITDAGGEFSLGGSAANGVVVDGAATLVSGNTYRYAFSGSFGIGTVSVAFTEGTWADNSGNTNATLSESFTTVAVPEKLTIDNTDSENVSLSGRWRSGTGTSGYYGSNYVHDENKGKGSKSFTFTPSVATAASYEVYLRWTDGSNRANNVPVDIIHSNGTTTVTVDQTRNGGTWNLLGVFQFDAGTSGNVRLRNTGTNGYVIADAIQLIAS